MKKKAVLVLAGFSVAAVIACGGGGDAVPTPLPTATAVPPTSTPQSQAQSQSRVAPALLQTATPAPVARLVESESAIPEGGVFKRLWSDPPTLDPHQASDTTSAGIIVEIFSGLVTLNPDLKITPDLAESWTIGGDGKVYTFKLREGLKFSNGKPVTAADFKWSFERAANPDTESTVAELYLGDIVGVQAIVDGDATEASGIEVIDERTLRITIDDAKPYFLAKLTYPTAFVLDRQNVEASGDSWTENPVGSGPFVLEDYRVGERIVLARNENFNGRKAYLDKVLFNLAGGVAMAMYENDEIDITGVGLADLERVTDASDPLNADLVRVPPGFSVSYVGFKTDEPPFDDVKFRQALNHAVNKELIAEQVYAGLVKPAYGVIPPEFPGYSENIQGLRYDPDLARQLLSESKYADPETRPRIVITIPGTGGSPSLDVEIVADMWRKELGVRAEIQQVEWATYLQDLNRERLQAFGGLGWQADYPDPQDFLDILFYSDSPGNHGVYSHPEVDKYVIEARTEPDPRRRIDLYNKAEQIVINDAAWLPLWFDTEGLALVKGKVKGFRFTPIIVPKLRDVYIEK